MPEEKFSKLCDYCGIQPAILFFLAFNGKKEIEQGLCPQCALKRFTDGKSLDLGIGQADILNTINEMRYILTDIANHINKITENSKDNIPLTQAIPDQTCITCNHSKSDIINLGNVGCNVCYHLFSDEIKEKLFINGFGTKHRGQIPSRLRKIYFKKLELEKLNYKLLSLINKENYEEAAKISKRISKLKEKI
ncbi:MAG: hypothetical protein ACRCTQ_05235 [Brevinemataceae bacterium]